MNRTLLIFDYFKEAFHLNQNNKVLYKPQIILIIIKSIINIMIGVYFFNFFSRVEEGFSFEDFFSDGKNIVLLILFIILYLLLAAIATRIVEAGLYNMYKSCIADGSVKDGDFWKGVSKYFFKFLFGDILIIIAWIVCLIPYFLLGIMTLSIGFTIVPIIVSIFLTMWRVSLVINDYGIIESFKDSFRFARRNFYQLFVLQIINWSFTRSNSSGGSINYSDIEELIDKGKDNGEKLSPQVPFDPSTIYNYGSNSGSIRADQVIKHMKAGIAIITPIATIIFAVAALVKMIFEIYFAIVLFAAYKGEFKDDSIEQKEVIE